MYFDNLDSDFYYFLRKPNFCKLIFQICEIDPLCKNNSCNFQFLQSVTNFPFILLHCKTATLTMSTEFCFKNEFRHTFLFLCLFLFEQIFYVIHRVFQTYVFNNHFKVREGLRSGYLLPSEIDFKVQFPLKIDVAYFWIRKRNLNHCDFIEC